MCLACNTVKQFSMYPRATEINLILRHVKICTFPLQAVHMGVSVLVTETKHMPGSGGGGG